MKTTSWDKSVAPINAKYSKLVLLHFVRDYFLVYFDKCCPENTKQWVDN